MKRVSTLVVLLVVVLASAGRAQLAGEVQAVLQNKLLQKAKVGIEIIRLGQTPADARVVFQHNANLLLLPASNMKVLTTSAALDHLGADFKFRTYLVRHGQDLILWGDGDPSLGDSEMLRKTGWAANTAFIQWAERLKKLNITTVHNVVVDDSIFDMEFLHPRWVAHQFTMYGAEIGGVNLNLGCVEYIVRPGSSGHAVFATVPATHYLQVQNSCVSGKRNAMQLARRPGTNEIILSGEVSGTNAGLVTIHDPPMFAATMLADTLAAQGVTVTGQTMRDRTNRQSFTVDPNRSKDWSTIGVLETPVSVALSRANKDSCNQYAESLCKRLGAAVSGTSGSWANGTAAAGEFLKKAGVSSNEFKLDDGSGLSKSNGITPNAIARVLVYDHHSKNAQTFLNSLAVGGEDGTLRHRFAGDLRGRVFAKTGFVEGVSALSGYLKGRDGSWYAFSILMNGIPHLSNSQIKPLQERIIHALDAGGGK